MTKTADRVVRAAWPFPMAVSRQLTERSKQLLAGLEKLADQIEEEEKTTTARTRAEAKRRKRK